MKIRKLDHVGIVVNDLPAAKAFFLILGLKRRGKERQMVFPWVDVFLWMNLFS